MFLVLLLPFRQQDGHLFVEEQAANGLARWADNFTKVTLAAPVIPEWMAQTDAGIVWRRSDAIEHSDRIELLPLPWAYTPPAFFKALGPARKTIREAIAASQYLQFAIGGLFGDWSAVAAMEAIKLKRRYAIHTDRVEHELIRKTASSQPLLRRIRITVEAPLMERYHRHVINHCSLGLWHGDECFRAYSPWGRENHLIHDVHTKQADLIDAAGLERKIQDVRNAEVLRLCYAGRLEPMKAPLEWLRSVAVTRALGVQLKATWFGDGSMMDEAKAEAARLNLEDVVSFPGFVAGRPQMLENLRSAHALLFTHVTPESPRILLETLVCGTPMLGYDNPFAVNLVEGHGGGAFVPMHDTQALGALIASLASNPEKLVAMTREAAANGRRFSDAAVFAERSDLIKRYT
jgi:glycosyltransferase involved in cell wall biosynthesis